MHIDLVILTILVVAAVQMVMARTLVRVAIGFTFTSVAVSILMFRLNAPMAGVFELSVCGGLITVIFVSAIGLTRALHGDEIREREKSRVERYRYLPIIVVIVGAVLLMINLKFNMVMPPPDIKGNVREVIWNHRFFDIIGQSLILLAGVFGVALLLKEKENNEH